VRCLINRLAKHKHNQATINLFSALPAESHVLVTPQVGPRLCATCRFVAPATLRSCPSHAGYRVYRRQVKLHAGCKGVLHPPISVRLRIYACHLASSARASTYFPPWLEETGGCNTQSDFIRRTPPSSQGLLPIPVQPGSEAVRSRQLLKGGTNKNPFRCILTDGSRNSLRRAVCNTPDSNLNTQPIYPGFDYHSPPTRSHKSLTVSSTHQYIISLGARFPHV
jgi:hypothetical protein